MFLIFDKSQITSYFISIGTVAFLFVMAFIITRSPEAIQTVVNETRLNNYIEEKSIDIL